MMHVQELETMQRCGMRVLVVVLNDGAYGSEIHKLRARGMSDRGAVFGRPDLAAVARGFGLPARRLVDLAELQPFSQDFAAGTGPALLDIPISDEVMAPRMASHVAALY